MVFPSLSPSSDCPTIQEECENGYISHLLDSQAFMNESKCSTQPVPILHPKKKKNASIGKNNSESCTQTIFSSHSYQAVGPSSLFQNVDQREDQFSFQSQNMNREWCYSTSGSPSLSTTSLVRDPIAPGLYTRVRKRSINIFEKGDPSSTSHELDTSKEPNLLEIVSDSRMSNEEDSTNSIFAPPPNVNLGGIPVIQEFILDSQFRIVVEGRKLNQLKLFFFYLICVLSFGIFYLMCLWFPKIRSICTSDQISLARATHVFIQNSHGQTDFIPVKRSYYGRLLKDIFGKHRVHECIIVEEVMSYPDSNCSEAAITADKSPFETKGKHISSTTDSEDHQSIKSISSSHSKDALIYSHTCQLQLADIDLSKNIGSPSSIPMEHVSVKDSVSLSSSLFGANPSSSDFLYYFQYRHIKFTYHPILARYFENGQWEGFHSLKYEKLSEGLSDTLAEQRKIIFGPNLINIQEKSVGELFCSEIAHPFNVFQIFSIILWCLDNYYMYAGAIFFISLFTITVCVRETKKNLQNMIRMSRHVCPVNLYRNGEWSKFSSENIVPGDVFELLMSSESENSVPCDALLLDGDCIVNESMLTGESVPVSKSPIQEDFSYTNLGAAADVLQGLPLDYHKSILYGGTKLVRARNHQDFPVKAVAIRTGFNTTKGHLMRNILFPRPLNFKFYRDSMRFIMFLTVIAMIGFASTIYLFISYGVSIDTVILRALDLFTIVIPPALPLSMSIATVFAMQRLKKCQIHCISPWRINVAGKLGLFCFDKTGTLTEEGLDLQGLHVPHLNSVVDDYRVLRSLDESFFCFNELQPLVSFSNIGLAHIKVWIAMAMASCHSLKRVDGVLIGDPLEIKMFEWTKYDLEDSGYFNGSSVATIVRPPLLYMGYHDKSKKTELGIVKIFEFIPTLRRMATLTKIFAANGLTAFVKGAPESIRDICVPASIPSHFGKALDHFAAQGLRVIAMAMKSMPNLNWVKAQKIHRKEVESDLNFLGFIIFENKLKPVTASVLHELKKASFRTVISTGDNTLTALSVAKDCGIIEESALLFLPQMMESATLELDSMKYEGELRIQWEGVCGGKSYTLSPTSLTLPLQLIKENGFKVSFAIGCTGNVMDYLIDHCSKETLQRVLMKCHVFARMSPDQKQRLVECFQQLEYCVGFCGDGANDCGALKAADVGLSLSEAEASVAAPFTCKVPDIQCILDLIREGRSSLVTSFSCFKFMALYSLIQFTTISFLYYYNCNLSDGHFVIIDLFIIIPIAVTVGQHQPTNSITANRPTAKLMSRNVLVSLTGQILLQFLAQLFAFLLTKEMDWYVPPDFQLDDSETKAHIVTVLFNFSTFMYIIAAIMFCYNPLYQMPMWTNRAFVIVIGFAFCTSLYMLLCPFTWPALADLLDMEVVPVSYRYVILLMVTCYAVLTILAEWIFFPTIQMFIKRYARKQKKVKTWKRIITAIESEPAMTV